MCSQVFVEPRHDAVQAIGEMLLLTEAVPFAWVDDELRRHAIALEPAIELLTLAQWVDHIVLALQNERWRSRILDVRDRRAAPKPFRLLVGQPVEPLVVRRMILRAILGREIREPGAGDGGLEPRRLRNRPLGHVPTVRPPRDAES